MSVGQATANVTAEVPLSWFGKTLWNYSPYFIELVFLGICLRLLGLVEPFIFQVIIDRILPFQREASLIVVVAVFAAATLFQVGFEILSAMLSIITANRVTRDLGSRIFDHLLKLPYSYFRSWSVGETITRISETDRIRSFLIGTTTGTILDIVFVIIYVAILFTLSPTLTLIVLTGLPLQVLVYLSVGPLLRRRMRAQFDAGAQHQSQMVENITGITAVKSLSAESEMLYRLEGSLGHALSTSYRVGTLSIVNSKLILIIKRSITLAIILVGAQQVFDGQLTLGQLIAFHLLVDKVTSPIANFSKLWESWQNIKVSRQRLGDIVNTPTEAFGEKPLLPRELGASLQFKNVSFAYDNHPSVIKNFDFEAKPNTLTLIVGPSGIGKTTFGRLAAGIDRPSNGVVLLGGEDISGFDPHDVRNQIAYVPQEPYLFSGTIRENFLIGNNEVTAQEIEAALEVVNAGEFVSSLQSGLDSPVGERGTRLSGGQRQRIAIARSILKKPKVLILDEPTSALDTRAQSELAAALEKFKTHTTLIVITHRPEVFTATDATVYFEKTQ